MVRFSLQKDTKEIKSSRHVNNFIPGLGFDAGGELGDPLGSGQKLTGPGVRTASLSVLLRERNNCPHSRRQFMMKRWYRLHHLSYGLNGHLVRSLRVVPLMVSPSHQQHSVRDDGKLLCLLLKYHYYWQVKWDKKKKRLTIAFRPKLQVEFLHILIWRFITCWMKVW